MTPGMTTVEYMTSESSTDRQHSRNKMKQFPSYVLHHLPQQQTIRRHTVPRADATERDTGEE